MKEMNNSLCSINTDTDTKQLHNTIIDINTTQIRDTLDYE